MTSEPRAVTLASAGKLAHFRLHATGNLVPAAGDRDLIAAFSPTVTADVGGHALIGFHGSPASFDGIILPDTPQPEFERMLAPHAAALMCGGHVHLQFHRRLGDTQHFNPGSVGLAYLHDQPAGIPAIDPWAEYAVVRSEGPGVALEFRRVPYDVGAYLRLLRASGRPHDDDAIAQYRVRA